MLMSLNKDKYIHFDGVISSQYVYERTKVDITLSSDKGMEITLSSTEYVSVVDKLEIMHNAIVLFLSKSGYLPSTLHKLSIQVKQ